MEQSEECKVEDVQATCGDNDVSGMSAISVESGSLASVQSDNSSIDEVVEDYDDRVDVDEVNGDVEDEEKDVAVEKSPVPDIEQCSIVEEESAEADVQVSSDKFCMSEINGTEVTDSTSQCDSSSYKTSPPENIEENSVSTEDMPLEGSSDKCDDGMEVASGNNSTLKTGIVYLSSLI